MKCLIFTPATCGDRALKAWAYDVDSVILDLEDAVAADHKDAARAAASELIDRLPEPWTVRVNALGSEWWRDDLMAVLHPNLACVMVPKVQSADMIQVIDDILSSYESRHPRREPIRLLPIIESARGLAAARAIAVASPRVDALTFGEGDFSLDLGLDWDPFSTLLTIAKAQLALDSRLADIAPPHAGAYPRLHDLDGLTKSCELARSLGFGTKHCIHPEQVPVVRRTFAPTQAATARAGTIVARFEAALAEGAAAIDVDGMFVDYPVYRRAQQTLRMAERQG